jgi:hypothetical protein
VRRKPHEPPPVSASKRWKTSIEKRIIRQVSAVV